MKPFRIVQFLAFVATCFCVQAQDTLRVTNKKGVPLLPKAGDWGFAIDASPLTSYLGNLFSERGQNNLFVSGLGVRYFKNEKLVYLINANLFTEFATNKNNVDDVTDSGFRQVTDEISDSRQSMGLSFGFERRRNKSRLVPYLGGYFSCSLDREEKTFSYGNVLSVVHPAVPSTGWTGTTPFRAFLLSERPISSASSQIWFSLAATVGLEYFIAPKFSARFEFSGGVSYSPPSKSSSSVETFNQQRQLAELSDVTTRFSGRRFQTSLNQRSSIMLQVYF